MAHAELIALMEKLPPERQDELMDFAEFLVARSNAANAVDAGDEDRRQRIMVALHAARMSFPPCDPERLRKEFADMRNEWERPAWGSQH